jgi:hypothetical protein
MKWWEYSQDEREVWRQQELTQAYLDELREQDDVLVTEALNDALANRPHSAVVAAAKLEGMVLAIRVATDEDRK